MQSFKGRDVVVRHTEREDIDLVAQKMRWSDVRDAKDGLGLTPHDVLATGFTNSWRCWTITVDEIPGAMFGVGKAREEYAFGVFWYYATHLMDKDCDSVWRILSGEYFREIHKYFSTIGNLFACRHTRNLEMLRQMGFVRQYEYVNRQSGVPFVFMIRDGRECVNVG